MAGSGVRKQPTEIPLTRGGGNDGGTPITGYRVRARRTEPQGNLDHLIQQAQDAGWQLLAARYEKTRFAKQLMTRISECRGQLSEHRRDNFTGTMLRHHHHKSTQYMAQWIAAKNRLQGA